MSANLARENDFAMRVIEFNAHVARFAHHSWLVPVGGTNHHLESLFNTRGRIEPRAEPHASMWLLREIGLQDDSDWEMAEPQKRIWLIPQPALGLLMRDISLTLHREWLGRIIDGTRVRALRAALGERALRFATEEVPREAFHHREALVHVEAEPVPALPPKLEEDGARTLMGLLSPAWRAVRGRAQLYLDRSLQLGEVAPLDSADAERALDLVCRQIIPRRLPEWAWLF
jgi:hypothetical protein